MVYSELFNFLFIHVPRTAGGSMTWTIIRTAEEEAEFRRVTDKYSLHPSYRQLREEYGERLDTAFTFSTVRNSWDWPVSLFEYARQEPTHYLYEETQQMTFAEFLPELLARYNPGVDQLWYLQDDDGNVAVDFLIRFEKLEEGFATIKEKLGFPSVTKLRRQTATKHEHYSTYYTPELEAFVGEHFARDIETFGFTFERMA